MSERVRSEDLVRPIAETARKAIYEAYEVGELDDNAATRNLLLIDRLQRQAQREAEEERETEHE